MSWRVAEALHKVCDIVMAVGGFDQARQIGTPPGPEKARKLATEVTLHPVIDGIDW